MSACRSGSEPHQQRLRERCITPLLAQIREPHRSGLGKTPRVVERSIATPTWASRRQVCGSTNTTRSTRAQPARQLAQLRRRPLLAPLLDERERVSGERDGPHREVARPQGNRLSVRRSPHLNADWRRMAGVHFQTCRNEKQIVPIAWTGAGPTHLST
jgi:hypothetical protein